VRQHESRSGRHTAGGNLGGRVGVVGPKRARLGSNVHGQGGRLAMTKMAFTGELDDVIDTVMANWRYL
jgi:hypothetical protein